MDYIQQVVCRPLCAGARTEQDNHSCLLPSAVMTRSPPRYPAGYRVNITTCALCGRSRSRRYRSSLGLEPLVCSKCVRASAPPNVVIELRVHGDGNAHVEPNASPMVAVSPTEAPPRPTELPAGDRGRSCSQYRDRRRLSPIQEEPPVVDRSTKPRTYRRP